MPVAQFRGEGHSQAWAVSSRPKVAKCSMRRIRGLVFSTPFSSSRPDSRPTDVCKFEGPRVDCAAAGKQESAAQLSFFQSHSFHSQVEISALYTFSAHSLCPCISNDHYTQAQVRFLATPDMSGSRLSRQFLGKRSVTDEATDFANRQHTRGDLTPTVSLFSHRPVPRRGCRSLIQDSESTESPIRFWPRSAGPSPVQPTTYQQFLLPTTAVRGT